MRGYAGVIVSSLVHRSEVRQLHYFSDLQKGETRCLEIDFKGATDGFESLVKNAKKTFSVSEDIYPYGFQRQNWLGYCMAPHGYTPLGGGRFQVGFNLFNRFMIIDTVEGKSYLKDPGIDDQCLSTNNWVDPASGDVWFGSWYFGDTLKRLSDPAAAVSGTIWKQAAAGDRPVQVWTGQTGDALHQVALSNDRRFVILCELGLYSEINGAAGQARKLLPSTVIILDLEKECEWQLHLPAAAHIEFDPDDPHLCYLSSHNIGLINGRVGIFGPGAIMAYRFESDGPKKLGEFTHPDFYRITTHQVFNHRGRVLMAVTAYPRTIFLIDPRTMKLWKKILLGSGEDVRAGKDPHICTEDAYGLTASPDGEHLYVSETGRQLIIDVHAGEPVFSRDMGCSGSEWCFTGHSYLSTVDV